MDRERLKELRGHAQGASKLARDLCEALDEVQRLDKLRRATDIQLKWAETRLAKYVQLFGTVRPEDVAKWLDLPPVDTDKLDSVCRHPRQRFNGQWLPCATKRCPYGYADGPTFRVFNMSRRFESISLDSLGRSFETFTVTRMEFTGPGGLLIGLWRFPDRIKKM